MLYLSKLCRSSSQVKMLLFLFSQLYAGVKDIILASLCTHLLCQKDLKLVTKAEFWLIWFLIFTYTSNLFFLDNLLFSLIDWALKASTAQVISKTVSLPIPSEKECCFPWLKAQPFWAVYLSQLDPRFNECPVAHDFASKTTQEKRSSVSFKYL